MLGLGDEPQSVPLLQFRTAQLSEERNKIKPNVDFGEQLHPGTGASLLCRWALFENLTAVAGSVARRARFGQSNDAVRSWDFDRRGNCSARQSASRRVRGAVVVRPIAPIGRSNLLESLHSGPKDAGSISAASTVNLPISIFFGERPQRKLRVLRSATRATSRPTPNGGDRCAGLSEGPSRRSEPKVRYAAGCRVGSPGGMLMSGPDLVRHDDVAPKSESVGNRPSRFDSPELSSPDRWEVMGGR